MNNENVRAHKNTLSLVAVADKVDNWKKLDILSLFRDMYTDIVRKQKVWTIGHYGYVELKNSPRFYFERTVYIVK